MRTITAKYQSVFFVLLIAFFNLFTVEAQCDFTQMTATAKHAICSNDGSITVSVPGNCDTQVVLREADGTYVGAGSVIPSGSNSTITFSNLLLGSYNLFYMDGSIERPYANNPVIIKDVYVPMEIDPYFFTRSTCKDMTDPDGTIRVKVKTGTGIGPFIYELTTVRGTQTSAPTNNREYTFGDNYYGNGVLSGETVHVTVTDTKNGLCTYSVSQQPVVPPVDYDAYAYVSNHRFIETQNCDEFTSVFQLYTSYGNSQSYKKIYEHLQIPGNATIEVTPDDGSAPYTANLTMDPEASPTSASRYFYGPNLKKGDKYIVVLKEFCGGTDRKTNIHTVDHASDLYLSDRSTLTIDPITCEKIEEIKLNYYYSTYYYYLKKPNGTLKLYKQEGTGWVETQPKSGELLFNINDFPNSTNSNTLTLHDWGTYKLEYTDDCGVRFSKQITLTIPKIGYFTINQSAPSMHGNTGGIDVRLYNFNYSDSLTFLIESKAGPEVKTFMTTKPFSGETYEQSISFPYSFKAKVNSNTWVHINDIPEGEYRLTVTDKCDISYSLDFRQISSNLVRYNPKNTDYFVNGIKTEFGCSNSNRLVLDFGSNNKERAYVTLFNKDNNQFYKTDGTSVGYGGTNIDYTNGMAFSNLPSGNYELHFYRFWYSGTNYSLILNEDYNTSYSSTSIRNIIPVSIKLYADLAITNYADMCDSNTDSGMIDIRITDGTPAYPILYELFNMATGVKADEYLDSTFGSENHLFTGLPKGTYIAKVSNGYNQVLGTSCGTTEGIVVVDDFGIPEIIKSNDNIYVSDSSTLSLPISPDIYNVTWYKVVGANEIEIGTGTSITVYPDYVGVHYYKAKIEFNLLTTPCPVTAPQYKTTTITVLERNYWMGNTTDIDPTNWDVPSNWTANRTPLIYETIEFATVDNYGTAAVNDLHLAQPGEIKDRIIGNLINNSDMNFVVTTGSIITIRGTVQDNNPNAGTIVVKSNPNEPTGTLVFTNPGQNQNVGATVEFYNKGYDCADCGMFRRSWQYFGIPVQSLNQFPTGDVAGEETINQWTESFNGDKWRPAVFPMTALTGYEITNSSNTVPTDVYKIEGELFVGNANVTLTRTANVNYSGTNLVSNPYTAAIDIKNALAFSAGVQPTIYLFNTGTRDEWRKLDGSTVTGYKAGQYLAVPQNLAGTNNIPDRIPSMHAFMIRLGSGTTADLHISYNNLIKNSTVNDGNGTQITWRSGEEDAEYDSSLSLPSFVVDVIGKESADRAWIFTEPNSTLGYDEGWDGHKIKETGIAQIYTIGETNDEIFQVATVPELDNLLLGFDADNDGRYTLEFALSDHYAESTLYLLDLDTGIGQRVENNGFYSFDARKGDSGARFKLTYELTDNNNESQVSVRTIGRQVVITNYSNKNYLASIFSVDGKLVSHIEIAPGVRETTDVMEGIYIVRLQNEQSNIVKKVIAR